MPAAIAIPIAAGLAGVGSAAFGLAGARARAEGMFPGEYERRLARLKRKREKGFGLSEGRLAEMEAAGVAQRASLSAQQQARQLQAASAASGGALSGRDLFVQEMGLQDAMARQLDEESRRIAEADRLAAEAQRQELMELAQRKADAEAARKSANRQFLADLAGTAGTVAVGAIGAKASGNAFDELMDAQDIAARNSAMKKLYRTNIAMGAAGAFGRTAWVPPPSPDMISGPPPTVPMADTSGESFAQEIEGAPSAALNFQGGVVDYPSPASNFRQDLITAASPTAPALADPLALNFQGGVVPPSPEVTADPRYRELYSRWQAGPGGVVNPPLTAEELFLLSQFGPGGVIDLNFQGGVVDPASFGRR